MGFYIFANLLQALIRFSQPVNWENPTDWQIKATVKKQQQNYLLETIVFAMHLFDLLSFYRKSSSSLSAPIWWNHRSTSEWKHLRLAVSHRCADWCHGAFETSLLSCTERDIHLLPPGFNKKYGARAGHTLASVWQAASVCRYCDLCEKPEQTHLNVSAGLVGSAIELKQRRIKEFICTQAQRLFLWGCGDAPAQL